MTTPTKEQVMQWMEQSGLGGFSMSDEISKLATLARADLEATIAEKDAETRELRMSRKMREDTIAEQAARIKEMQNLAANYVSETSSDVEKLKTICLEQAAEIADYELANSNIHKWRNKYRASISSEIEKANSLSRQLTAEQAKIADLEAIEANLCDLHNVALEQLEAEQAKVQELGGALTLLWVNEDRALWDIKAVENFDRLILKTGEIK